MELSIREAAALLGRSERTVRAQLRSGVLAGHKRGRAWLLPSEQLPLTEVQRRKQERLVGEARSALEQALPERFRREKGEARSVLNFEAFVAGIETLRGHADSLRAGAVDARSALTQALETLAAACHEFDLPARRALLRDARSTLARLVGRLHLESLSDPASDLIALAQRIEQTILPPIGGLLRWIDKTQRRARAES